MQVEAVRGDSQDNLGKCFTLHAALTISLFARRRPKRLDEVLSLPLGGSHAKSLGFSPLLTPPPPPPPLIPASGSEYSNVSAITARGNLLGLGFLEQVYQERVQYKEANMDTGILDRLLSISASDGFWYPCPLRVS